MKQELTDEQLLALPPLPKPVGKVTRQHETPGHMVADGGRIVSVPFFIVEDVSTLENLFTTGQMREYAQAALDAKDAESAALKADAERYRFAKDGYPAFSICQWSESDGGWYAIGEKDVDAAMARAVQP